MDKDKKSCKDLVSDYLDQLNQSLDQFPVDLGFDDNDDLTDAGIWYLNKILGASGADIGKLLGGKSTSTVSRRTKKFGDLFDDDQNTSDLVVKMRDFVDQRELQATHDMENLSNGDASKFVKAAKLKKRVNQRVRGFEGSLQILSHSSFVSLFHDDTSKNPPHFEPHEGCPQILFDSFRKAFNDSTDDYLAALKGQFTPDFSAFDKVIEFMQANMTDNQRHDIKIALSLHNLDRKTSVAAIDDAVACGRLYAERDDNNEIHVFGPDPKDPDSFEVLEPAYNIHHGTINHRPYVTTDQLFTVDADTLDITPKPVFYDDDNNDDNKGLRVALWQWKMPHIHICGSASGGIALKRWGQFLGLYDMSQLIYLQPLKGRSGNNATDTTIKYSFNGFVGYLAHKTPGAKAEGKHEYTDWEDRIRHSDNLDVKLIMKSNEEIVQSQLSADIERNGINDLVRMCLDPNNDVKVEDLHDPDSALFSRLCKSTAKSDKEKQQFLELYNKALWDRDPGVKLNVFTFGDNGGIGKSFSTEYYLFPGQVETPTDQQMAIAAGGGSGNAGPLEDYECQDVVLFDDYRSENMSKAFKGVGNFLRFFDPHRMSLGSVPGRNHDTTNISAHKFGFTTVQDPYEFFQYIKGESKQVGSDSQWLRRIDHLLYVEYANIDRHPDWSYVRHFTRLGGLTSHDFHRLFVLDTKTHTHVNIDRNHYLFHCWCVSNHVGSYGSYVGRNDLGEIVLDQLNQLHTNFTIDDDLTFRFNSHEGPMIASVTDLGGHVPNLPIWSMKRLKDVHDWCFHNRDYCNYCEAMEFLWCANKYGLQDWLTCDPSATMYMTDEDGYDYRIRFENGNYGKWLKSLLMDQPDRYKLMGVIEGELHHICLDPNEVSYGDVYAHWLPETEVNNIFGGCYLDSDKPGSIYYKRWTYADYCDYCRKVERTIPGSSVDYDPLAYVINSFMFICDDMVLRRCAPGKDSAVTRADMFDEIQIACKHDDEWYDSWFSRHLEYVKGRDVLVSEYVDKENKRRDDSWLEFKQCLTEYAPDDPFVEALADVNSVREPDPSRGKRQDLPDPQ